MLKRYIFLLLAAAATLGTVRPPVPIAGGAKCPRFPFALCPRLWDERHVPSHEVDDVILYGEGLVWQEHWALWLLVASIALAAGSASSMRGAAQCLPTSFVFCCVHVHEALSLFKLRNQIIELDQRPKVQTRLL
jgi:hypothetical protein